MNNLVLVNVVDRRDHVIEDAARVTLLDWCVDLDHEVAHVTQHQVHHDVDVLLVLVKVVELGNARVIQGLHDLLLAVNCFGVSQLQLGLTVYFNRNLFAGNLVVSFVDVGLTPLAQYLSYVISILKSQPALLLAGRARLGFRDRGGLQLE